MSTSPSGKKGKGILSLITINDFVEAILSLGDRCDDLKKESWRLNKKADMSTSLWNKIIHQLNLTQTEKNRHALYDLLHSPRYRIDEMLQKIREGTEEIKNHLIDGNEERRKSYELHQTDPSISLNVSTSLIENHETRASKLKKLGEENKPVLRSDTSLVLSCSEWKTVFSKTHQKMRENWTDLFYKKILNTGVKCPLKFKTPYIKQGVRKHMCRFFCCYATCTINMCQRKYQITLQVQPDEKSSALFLLKTFGEEIHDFNVETSSRKLRGEQRLEIGKHVNEIGPLAAHREQVKAADESLLLAGNQTQCQTIETLKMAAHDYRRKLQLDEDVYKECRIIAYALSHADVSSTIVKGFVQMVSEIPFRLHLFTELQLERYVKYCSQKMYTYIHIDATGGILKKTAEQESPLLYAVIFKDGGDSNDTFSVGHAVLTDQTVSSVSFFLSSLSQSVAKLKGRPVSPSFFVIDFSAVLLNSILQVFCGENIVSHLNRCWNVLCGMYTAHQLQSTTYIHFCCCHVIHAIARNLNALKVEKKLRKSILQIFAIMLCQTNLNELYDILGDVVEIFGEANTSSAQKKLDHLIIVKQGSHFEINDMMNDTERVFEIALKEEDKLRLVDEYLRENIAIIHQSPFNREAIRRYPQLKNIIFEKPKNSSEDNSFFSPSIIRLFYRWWAYLPLWSGLLWNFREKYAKNSVWKETSLDVNVRHSNALIESYFRTLKGSILQRKILTRAGVLIIELHKSIQSQMKAVKYDVTQSAKGRKRKCYPVLTETWRKNNSSKSNRSIYFNKIDKIFIKKNQVIELPDLPRRNVKIEERRKSTSDSSSRSTSVSFGEIVRKKSDESNDDSKSDVKQMALEIQQPELDFSIHKQAAENLDNMADGSFNFDLVSSHDVAILDRLELMTADMNSDSLSASSNFKNDQSYPEKTCDGIDEFCYTHNVMETFEDISIDNCKLKLPKFGIEKAIINGQSYKFTNTCAMDSALFCLYFMYRTNEKLAREIRTRSHISTFNNLITVFSLIDRKDWNEARIYWIRENNLLKNNGKTTIDMYGTVDENVFTFIKNIQQYSYEVVCSRETCKERIRTFTHVEIDMLSCENKIEKFVARTGGRCGSIMAKYEELSEADARILKCREGKAMLVDLEKTSKNYIRSWICDQPNVEFPCVFTQGEPPFLIIQIKPFSKKNQEGYEPMAARLRDLKKVISVAHLKYNLSGVINHRNNHFTTTVIDREGQLYLFDDLNGLRSIRTSTTPVEYALYSRVD